MASASICATILESFSEQDSCMKHDQCDQKKLPKLPKNDFTRKMIDFDTFSKIA